METVQNEPQFIFQMDISKSLIVTNSAKPKYLRICISKANDRSDKMLCLTQSWNREINFRTAASERRKKGTGKDFFSGNLKFLSAKLLFMDIFSTPFKALFNFHPINVPKIPLMASIPLPFADAKSRKKASTLSKNNFINDFRAHFKISRFSWCWKQQKTHSKSELLYDSKYVM